MTAERKQTQSLKVRSEVLAFELCSWDAMRLPEHMDRILQDHLEAAILQEREACAKVAEVEAPDSAMGDLSSPPYCCGFADGQAFAAAAIRARSES